ncbi:MAG: ExbD/TolR family protein [Polyangiaceae bacterium]
MAGVDVGSDVGTRRSLTQEINMIPMIDLMMVTISFLLITAVWAHMSRMNANANMPHPCEGADCDKPPAETKTLHVDMRDENHFVLTWKRGDAVIDRMEVPKKQVIVSTRDERTVRYPDLAAKLGETWNASGEHRASSDRAHDRAVLHSDDGASYSDLVAVMDAIRSVERPVDEGDRTEKEPAFDLVFAMK